MLPNSTRFADLEINGDEFAGLVAAARATAVISPCEGFFLGGVGNDDAASGFFLGVNAL